MRLLVPPLFNMLYHHVSIVLFIVNVLIVTGREPDFVQPLENVTIPQGRDATFTCVVNNLGGNQVSSSSASGDHGGTKSTMYGGIRVAWIKADTKAILAIHEKVITNNGRLSVTRNDRNTWTLNIKGVRLEDRGRYMCQVNTDPMKSQSAFLEVVIPPDINYEETSGDQMIPEGGSATLVCKARGYPKPDIVWKREDGREIITRNSHSGGKTKSGTAEGETLVFQKVTRSEMGVYLCIASNGVPPSVSKRIKLYVHFRPLVQVPNQLVGAPLNTDVTLVCSVEASPKPINYWTREKDEMIINNDKYSMSETYLLEYSAQMRLVIRNLTPRDFGSYKCISKNSLGDAEGGIHLYEIHLPEHAKKGDRYGKESMIDQEQRLNQVYQGSLRESGSTLDPRYPARGHADSTSARHARPTVTCITLIVFYYMSVYL